MEKAIPFNIFGLQRTGTNLLQLLFTKNFHVFYANAGAEWKHGRVVNPDRRVGDEPLRFVVSVRNPYAWVVSCYRYFARTSAVNYTISPQFSDYPAMSFEEFVINPFFSFDTPMDCWNQMNTHWHETLPPDRTVIVRIEDLLERQLDTLGALEAQLGLRRKATDLVTEEHRIEFALSRGERIDPAHYREKRHLHNFPRQLLEFINERIDVKIMRRLGYETERTPDVSVTMGSLTKVQATHADNADGRDTSRRGIVVYGGLRHLLASVWVSVRMLRSIGCRLPIQFWYLSDQSREPVIDKLFETLGVQCCDLRERCKEVVGSTDAGKLNAILASGFDEVLYLDAEVVAAVDPSYLFDEPRFRETGAVFWPGFDHMTSEADSQALLQTFDTSHILLDRSRCLEPLQRSLDMVMRENAPLAQALERAWRGAGQPYAMPGHPLKLVATAKCQYDFAGRLCFQRRSTPWSIRNNPRISEFTHIDECFDALAELATHWRSIAGVGVFARAGKSPLEQAAADQLTREGWIYQRVGFDRRPITFREDGTVAAGPGRMETYWDILNVGDKLQLDIYSERELTCRLHPAPNDIWTGQWEKLDRMNIRLYRAKVAPDPAVEQHRLNSAEAHFVQHVVSELFGEGQSVGFLQIGTSPLEEQTYDGHWSGVIVAMNESQAKTLTERHIGRKNIRILQASVVMSNRHATPGTAAIGALGSLVMRDLVEMLDDGKCHFFSVDAAAADLRIVRSLFHTGMRPTLILALNHGNVSHELEIDDFLQNLVGYRCILKGESARMWVSLS